MGRHPVTTADIATCRSGGALELCGLSADQAEELRAGLARCPVSPEGRAASCPTRLP